MAAPAQSEPNLQPDRNTEYLTWDSEHRPVTISLRGNLAAALSRATPEEPIDGVLLGRAVPGRRPNVQIDLCLPIDSGYFANGSAESLESIRFMVERFKNDGTGAQVVGYFRSRSLRSLDPTPAERTLMKTQFSEPTDVLLIVDPVDDRLRCEFLVWSGGEVVAYDSRRPSRPTLMHRFRAAAAGFRVPLFAWATLAVVLCAAAAVWTVKQFPRSTPPAAEASAPAEELKLTVDRSGGNYNVSWSKELGRRYPNSVATLEAVEGSVRKAIAIDHEMFRSGRVYYTPSSGDVRFRMTVALDGKQQLNETVQAIASGFTPAGPGEGEASRTLPRASAMSVDATRPAASVVRVPAAPQRILTLLPPANQTAPPAPVPTVQPNGVEVHVAQRDVATLAPAVPEAIMPKAPPVTSAPVETVPAPVANRLPAPTNAASATPVAARIKRQVDLIVPADVKPLIRDDINISVKAFIDETGRVVRCEAASASGYAASVLGRIAEETTRHWQFFPAMLHGTPVPSQFLVEYRVRGRR